VASKAQAGDQVIVRFYGFPFAAAPIYMRGADRPILYPAILAGNCPAGFKQSLTSDVFMFRVKHGI
jgi:hypothetical protein